MELNFSIELTDYCNARCHYCIIGTGQPPHGENHFGFLTLEMFDNLFRDFDQFLKDPLCAPVTSQEVYLRFCGIGEPTLNPQFPDFFNRAMTTTGIKQLAVVTNGSYLEPKRFDLMKEAIESHPEVCVEFLLGLDAITVPAQMAVKKTKNIEKIKKDLQYILNVKRERRLRNLHLVFQLIVVDENREEVVPFCDFWKSQLESLGMTYQVAGDWGYLDRIQQYDAFIWIKRRDADGGDQVHFDTLHQVALREIGLLEEEVPTAAIPPTVLKAHQGEREIGQDYQPICGVFWFGINVNANGDVSPCCIDNRYELKVGNIREQTLCEIYRGPAMRHLRQAHITRDFQNYPLCQNCTSIHKMKYVSREVVGKYQTAEEALVQRVEAVR